jgi:8-hydroxy-5-deazaflavin:NADPH oxidoreductase
MRVAVIGTGNMGTGLGRQFAAAGHEVFVGSRDRERAKVKAEEIGAAEHGTYADAVAQAEAFLLAVNWWNIDEALPLLGDVDGKILIDCTNPYTDETYSTPADLGGRSAAEVLQQRLPGARVVKAWNHVYAQIVNSSPDFGGQPASVLLASDDAEAKEAVAGLARDAGYDPSGRGPAVVRLQRREGRLRHDHDRLRRRSRIRPGAEDRSPLATVRPCRTGSPRAPVRHRFVAGRRAEDHARWSRSSS